jgi:hypothetical protein
LLHRLRADRRVELWDFDDDDAAWRGKDSKSKAIRDRMDSVKGWEDEGAVPGERELACVTFPKRIRLLGAMFTSCTCGGM